MYYIILAIIICLVGVFMIRFPDVWFEIAVRRKVSGNAEPSRLFIISTRISGVICVIVGIVSIILLSM